jgi:hypothetical protein
MKGRANMRSLSTLILSIQSIQWTLILPSLKKIIRIKFKMRLKQVRRRKILSKKGSVTRFIKELKGLIKRF